MASSKRTSLNKGDDPLTALFGTPIKPATTPSLSSASRASKPAPTPTQNRLAASSPHAPPIPSIPSNFALMLEYDERHRDAEQAALEAQNAMQSEQQHAVAAMTYSPHHSRPAGRHTQAQTLPAPVRDESVSQPQSIATLPASLPGSQQSVSHQLPGDAAINKYLSHDLHNHSDRVSEAQQAARVKQLLGHRRSKTAVKLQQQLNHAAGGPARASSQTIEEAQGGSEDAASFIHDGDDGLTPATSPHQQRNGSTAHLHKASAVSTSDHVASTDGSGGALPSPISAEQAINQLKIDINAAPQEAPALLPWRRRSTAKASKELQRALADDWHIGSHGHLGGEKAAMAIDDVYLIQPTSTSYAAVAAASGSSYSNVNPNQPHDRALPGQFYVSTYRLYFQPDASHLNNPAIQHAYPWPYCSGCITTNLNVPLACIERIEIVERPKSHQPRLRQPTSPDPQHRPLSRFSSFATPAATPTPSAGNSIPPTPSSQRNQPLQSQQSTLHIATAHPPMLHQILEIHTRDGRVFRFGFFKPETCRKVFDGLALYAFPGKDEHLFAFNYKIHAPLPSELNGWQLYDAVREYKRMNIPSTDYTLSTLNVDYSLSITYPRILCTPSNKYMTDGELLEIAEFRSRGRLPVLVWKHPTAPQTIWRCSQPKVGVNNSRCQADEKLLYIVGQLNSECRTVTIFDARPKMNARANMLAGKGYENIDNYSNCKLVFLNIGNIHVMRESYQRLIRVCRSDVHDIGYLQGLAASGWLQHVSELMKGTVQMVLAVHRDKQSIVSHCSDGWDRTTQFVTLTELCLDPYYRTLTGFLVMIEKEWCSFGHQFYKRVGHMNRDPNNDDRSPIFLQWLDCVFQLQRQFPTHFEFNSLALVTIYDALNSCRFGTFLFNTEAERFKAEVHRRTVSLGTYMLASPAACSGAFFNPLYVPPDLQEDEMDDSTSQQQSSVKQNDTSSKFVSPTATIPVACSVLPGQVLYPSWSLKKLTLWSDCYLRYIPEQCEHGIQADELLHNSATTVFTDSYSAALINQLHHAEYTDEVAEDRSTQEQLYFTTAMVDGQRRYGYKGSYNLAAEEQNVSVDIVVSEQGVAELSVVASRAVYDEENPLHSPQASASPFHSPFTDVSSMPDTTLFEDALELRSPAVPMAGGAD